MHTIMCRRCPTVIDITGHFGRPPTYCGDDCRKAAHAARQRIKRFQLVSELSQLREQVAELSALAA